MKVYGGKNRFAKQGEQRQEYRLSGETVYFLNDCFGELINAFSPRDSKRTVGKVQLGGKGFDARLTIHASISKKRRKLSSLELFPTIFVANWLISSVANNLENNCTRLLFTFRERLVFFLFFNSIWNLGNTRSRKNSRKRTIINNLFTSLNVTW